MNGSQNLEVQKIIIPLPRTSLLCAPCSSTGAVPHTTAGKHS